MRRRTTGVVGLLALLGAGCVGVPEDWGTSAEAVVRAPAPDVHEDWETRTNTDPQTEGPVVPGHHGRARCTEQATYYVGTVCFALEPGNACNEVDNLSIASGTLQTLTSGYGFEIPGTGISVRSTEAQGYSTTTTVDVPGRDCHHCWRTVCYATRVQPRTCDGGRRVYTDYVVTYSSPVVDDDPTCVRTDTVCGCVDAGVTADAGASAVAAASDAGTPDAGADGGGDAG